MTTGPSRAFDEIIGSFQGDEVADISDKQKVILAEALAYKADILRIGSTREAKLAIDYLNQALMLNPNCKFAIQLQSSIRAELQAYQPDCART